MIAGRARVDADRAAMGGQLVHVEQRQVMRREYLLDSEERKVTEVLVVDGVELVLLHQSLQVRKFHGDDAARLEQALHAGNEVIQIRYVCQHIVAEQQVRL